jgi:carbamoyl-phosphate synthase small subunit
MSVLTEKTAHLVLEDGTVWQGYSAGKFGTTTGEICFNTGMTGYQEIYTDPSYYGQIMVNTNTHIGNYGVKHEESQSDIPKIAGLVCRSFSPTFSRKLADDSLANFFLDAGITAITGIDTRALVRHIRSKGAMNAIISSEIEDLDILKEMLSQVPSMAGLELSSQVSCKEPYDLIAENEEYRVAVLDLGVKKNILNHLIRRGISVKVFPAQTKIEDLKSYNPDGYFLSNGPGDPSVMSYAVDTAKAMISEDKPVFGICLGHQILAQTFGIGTFKMHHGHRGLNHPVKNLETGISEITSQNHGFGVNPEDVEKSSEIVTTHINLNDNSIEGFRHKEKPVFSVQYHPEAAPGPNDATYLFDNFKNLLSNNKSN